MNVYLFVRYPQLRYVNFKICNIVYIAFGPMHQTLETLKPEILTHYTWQNVDRQNNAQ